MQLSTRSVQIWCLNVGGVCTNFFFDKNVKGSPSEIFHDFSRFFTLFHDFSFKEPRNTSKHYEIVRKAYLCVDTVILRCFEVFASMYDVGGARNVRGENDFFGAKMVKLVIWQN